MDSRETQVRVFGLNSQVAFTHGFAPMLDAKVNIGISLEVGSHKVSALALDEFKPGQRIFISEGSLRFKPFEKLQIKAGAINQKEYDSPLFLTETVFVGVQEKFSYNYEKMFDAYFKAEQMIPGNHTLTNRLGAVDEGTPHFFLETVGLQIERKSFTFHTHLSHFSYAQLSNGVAQKSRFMGNQVGGKTGPDASFLYNYQGLNGFVELEGYIYKNYKIGFKGQLLRNRRAPSGRNTGHLLKVGLGLEESFDVWLDVFRNESDTTPAFYNSKIYGHNNRKGWGVGTKVKWPLLRSYGELQFVQAKPIDDDSIYQSDLQSIILSFTKELEF